MLLVLFCYFSSLLMTAVYYAVYNLLFVLVLLVLFILTSFSLFLAPIGVIYSCSIYVPLFLYSSQYTSFYFFVYISRFFLLLNSCSPVSIPFLRCVVFSLLLVLLLSVVYSALLFPLRICLCYICFIFIFFSALLYSLFVLLCFPYIFIIYFQQCALPC